MGFTKSETLNEKPKTCSIDVKFIPYKVLYFLLCGAHVGVIPYLPVFAKTSLGLSATTVGMLATCMQFSTALSKPIVGILADYIGRVKPILVVLTCLEVTLNLSMLFLPRINVPPSTGIGLQVANQESLRNESVALLRFAPPPIFDASSSHYHIKSSWERKSESSSSSKKANIMTHFTENAELHNMSPQINYLTRNNVIQGNHNAHDFLNRNFTRCKVKCSNIHTTAKCIFNNTDCSDSNTTNSVQCVINKMGKHELCGSNHKAKRLIIDFDFDRSSSEQNHSELHVFLSRVSYYHKNRFVDVPCNSNNTCSLDCKKSYKICQSSLHEDSTSKYFWIYATCAIFSAMSQGSIFTLSDTACFSGLKDTKAEFGKQRLWGAIGWGSLAPLAGFLNDLASDTNNRNDYSPGFYMMATLSGFFLLNVLCMKFESVSPRSPNASTELKKVICNKAFIFMEVSVVMAGFLTAFSACFVMWYLESLGSSRLLMGITLAVECLIGEAPFMFFSGLIISKIGHRNVLTLSFLAFSARFTGYYLLHNVWMVLPIELLNGLTYGLFYPTMTSYAKHIAPTGSETTLQGVFGGTFQGLGTGIGCLVAGMSFDKFGGRKSFLLAAVISAIAAVLNCILCLFSNECRKSSNNKENV